MENQSNHKLSNFWFGFILGGTFACSAAFFFGTKQGRKLLKKLLEMTEDAEETLKILLEEYGEEIRKKNEEIIDDVKKLQKNHSNNSLPPVSTLHKILDKIKILSPVNQKKTKHFFIKEE